MPTGTIRTRSFTYTIPTQNGQIEPAMEYEVICKYGNDNYVSIDSTTSLQIALSRAVSKIVEDDEGLKAIYIDKVNKETLENTEYIAITIS